MNLGQNLIFPKLKVLSDKCRPKTPFIVEEKLDGESMILWRGHAYGRRTSSVTGERENKWDQLPLWITNLAREVKVHGELHVEQGTASDVKSALKEGRETNWDGELCKLLRFTAYRLHDFTYPPYVARCMLEAQGWTIPEPLNHILGPEIWPADAIDTELLYTYAIRRDIEGWVLKAEDGEWFKYKVERTCDMVVVGFKEGNGKYLGQIGALLCKAGETEAAVGGMTDEMRETLTEMSDAGKLNGAVVEVEYQCVASAGGLRHPRFKRIREDKNANECTKEQFK